MEGKSGAIISAMTTLAAILFAFIYLWAAWHLYGTFAHVDAGDDKRWDHAWSIFTGIQSAGLSAIGVLLGVAVQQPRVTEAQARTAKAKDAIDQVLQEHDRSTNEAGGAGVSPEDSTSLRPGIAAILRQGLRA
jgi:hypothetical protein